MKQFLNPLKLWWASGSLLSASVFLAYMGLSEPSLFWRCTAAGFGVSSAIVGLRYGKRLWQLAGPKQSGRNDYLQQAQGRAVQFTANGKTGQLFLHSVPSIFGFKPKQQPLATNSEFVFFERNMSAIVCECELYDFCKRAWRRQQLWQFGQLTANQIFTREVFLNEPPRLTLSAYEAMLHILRSRGLLTGGRWQGKCGQLRYSPGLTVELAKKNWAI